VSCIRGVGALLKLIIENEKSGFGVKLAHVLMHCCPFCSQLFAMVVTHPESDQMINDELRSTEFGFGR